MTNFSGRMAALGLSVALASSCGSAPPRATLGEAPEGRLWVLAPHPDDEVLMAGELLRRAVAAHRPVSVLVMTNGDLGCERNGYLREAETISALAILGVAEDDVHFLGYPDGFLEVLGDAPLEPIARALPDGSCGLGTGTYAARGAGLRDAHRELFGEVGAYVASGPVGDLAALLERERPSEIVVAHPIDTHRDHAMTYVYLHRALEEAQLRETPTLLRAVVHQGACWPNGAGSEPCPDIRLSFASPMPPFAPPLDTYAPTLRISSEDGGLTKRRAIAAYASQLGTPVPEESWLSSFARLDEVFWATRLVGDPRHAGRLVREREGTVSVASADIVLGEGGSAFFEVAGIRLAVEALGLRLSHHGAELRVLPWRRGEDPTARHTYELRIDPRHEEGNVAEVTVRRDGELVAMAVVSGDVGDLVHERVVTEAESSSVDAREVVAE